MKLRREDGRNEPEGDLDVALAARFGAYASFVTPNDPIAVEFHGDSPAIEVDRLLDSYVNNSVDVLDLGCGAGFSLCRVAKHARSVLGIDLETELLESARERVLREGITNTEVLLGDTCDSKLVVQIPNSKFGVVFSRRGPFLTESLVNKLTDDAVFIVELAQDFIGLKELFGRTPFLPKSTGDPDFAISAQSGVGFVPVSAKSYWYEEYFSDAEHLARYLKQGAPLQNWWMDACPYEEKRDRPALDLYASYNQTDKGIMLVGHRRVYVFRRQKTQFYPVMNSRT